MARPPTFTVTLKQLPTCTLSLTAASAAVSPGADGRVVVQAAGVFESEFAREAALHLDLDSLIDAIGEQVLRDALDDRAPGLREGRR